MSLLQRTEYRVPLIYLILSSLWIVFSDNLLFSNITDSATATFLSIFKGLVFITTSTLVIYYLIKSDVVELRSANLKLKISQEYYYSLFSDNHTASLLLNPTTFAIDDANTAALILYGYTLEQMKGMNLDDLCGKKEAPFMVSAIADKISPDTRSFRQTIHKNSTNELLDVEVYSGPIELSNKKYLLVSVNNITNFKRNEQFIKQNELKYKKLVENIPDVFYIYSENEGFLYLSPKIKTLINYLPSKTDNLSDIIFKHIYIEDKSYYLTFRKNIFETQNPTDGTYRISDANNNIKWVQDRVFDISHIGEDTIIEGVISDITEKRRLMEELIQANYKVTDSLKLKNIILSNLNHELRTPLSGILGFGQLINRISEDQVVVEYSEHILESAQRLNNTLNSLLTLNEIEVGHRSLYFEEASLKEFLTIIYNTNSAFVEAKKLNFKIEASEDLKFFTDVSVLSQVMFNLIDNAVKFTNNGTITLRGEFITRNGMWIRISVIDTGIGIKDDSVASIFEPFRQASEGINRQYDGLGVGLTICNKLINLLGGKVEVETIPEKGSNFMVHIPFKIPEIDK